MLGNRYAAGVNDAALVLVAGLPDRSVGEVAGALPWRHTETTAAFSLPLSGWAAWSAAVREAAPEARVVVHVAPRDEVGMGLCARVLQLTPVSTTLFTAAAARALPEVVSVGRHRLPGTLRTVTLFGQAEATPPLADGLELPELPRLAVARTVDLASLVELLGFGIRAVALSGRPGVGKSHLLVRLAHALAAAGRRVAFLDVGGRGGLGILCALARELGVPVDPRQGEDRVLEMLVSGVEHADREVLLLDHLPARLPAVLVELVRRTSVTWVLAGTSRIGVDAEVTYELHPLRSTTGDVSDAAHLLGLHAPGLADEAAALAGELEGLPLAIELVAGWLQDAHPLRVLEWLAGERRSLEAIVAMVRSELDPALAECLEGIASWPDVIGVMPDHELVEALHRRGWLRREADARLPGVVRLRLHPTLRRLVLAHRASIPDQQAGMQVWMAGRCDRLLEMLDTERGPAVLDAVSAWIPSLDEVVRNVQSHHPVSSTDLATLASMLALRVAWGIRMEEVEGAIVALEKALQGAGARFDLDPMVVVRLFRARGEAFLHQRAWDRADADFRRALTLAERRKEIEQQARLHLLLARVALGGARLDVAERELNAADEVVPEGVLWRGELAALRGKLLSLQGEAEGALVALADAEGHLVGGNPAVRAQVLTERAVLCRRLGRPGDARLAYLGAIRAWGRAGRPNLQTAMQFQLALLLQSNGDLEGSMQLLRAVEERAEAYGEDARRGLVCVQRALIELERGDLVEAEKSLVEGLSAARLGGDRSGQGTARGFLALSQHLRGEADVARQGYRSAIRDLESGADRRYGALFHCLLGAAEAELGNLGEARILVDMARLRLPYADAAMREAIGVFEGAVLAIEQRAAGQPMGDRIERLQQMLGALGTEDGNIYLRVARRYLWDLMKESA